MRVKNFTNIPDETIRKLIDAVRPPSIAGFDVVVKNTDRGLAGMAYYKGSGYHDRACPFVTLRVSKTERNARHLGHGREGKGYLTGYAIGSRLEALVFVMSHELRHLWQSKVKSGRRVWGARGQFSERDADAYALQMLRKFRRGELGSFEGPPADKAPPKPRAPRVINPIPSPLRKYLPEGTTIEGDTLYAPEGKVWSESGCHGIEISRAGADAFDSLIADLKMGVEDCTEPECDLCPPKPRFRFPSDFLT